MIELLSSEIFGTATVTPLQSLVAALFLIYPFFSLPIIVYLWRSKEAPPLHFERPALLIKRDEMEREKARKVEIKERPLQLVDFPKEAIAEPTDLAEAARALAMASETSADLRAAALDFLVSRSRRGRARKRKIVGCEPSDFAEILASSSSRR